ncbi:hypothetical protein PF002_g19593 [Phytophthora fragariae]|uniref:Uncharacterized protein n=2 Tax=Phytophthora TaxID=4783 RepID=A0A6A3MC71_9STRA|nr:hypothetical protein PF003_g14096 [Phytophthora fragariae]KAE9017996.1 hypothetical protein PR001_g14251 [Phytophthora rubi]KAE9029869.1 hypothetical protein PR002_g10010 [Phytophthora rubi]KAE9207837.1 hypothetical protein PF002_g19593 [Phytophthora fragariae]KAE9318826.1 hypothetical protein PR003_g18141 [Phytophthora rubi]
MARETPHTHSCVTVMTVLTPRASADRTSTAVITGPTACRHSSQASTAAPAWA